MSPSQSCFRQKAILDYRDGKEPNLAATLKPGDLIVNYVSLGRSVTQREWLFAVLPYGHAMVVVDPKDEEAGLFECRFRGCKRIALRDLKRCSFSIVYRLDDSDRINLERLREFAEHSRESCNGYSFASWFGINGNLTPDSLDRLSRRYTCSTFAVAAYHYAGATLSVVDHPRRVITPLSLAASHATWNAHALP